MTNQEITKVLVDAGIIPDGCQYVRLTLDMNAPPVIEIKRRVVPFKPISQHTAEELLVLLKRYIEDGK